MPVATRSIAGRGASAPERWPVAASSAIADLITGPVRAASVVGADRHALYLQLCDEPGIRLAVVSSDAVRMPFAIRLPHVASTSPLLGVRVGERASVGLGAVSVARLHVGVGRWWNAHPAIRPLTHAELARWRDGLDLFGASRRAPGLAYDDDAVFAFGIALARHDGAEAVRAAGRLIGRGPGSTPSGDDVVAAVLAAVSVFVSAYPAAAAMWEACGRPVGRAVVATADERTTPVSAALLRHAVRGEPTGEVADVLRAAAGPPEALNAAILRLLAVGHTSGADCLQGLRILAAALAPRFARSAATDRSTA